MLYYSIDHPDPDNNFTVTVVPINGAGLREDATTLSVFGKHNSSVHINNSIRFLY